jgi:hypothetical protein
MPRAVKGPSVTPQPRPSSLLSLLLGWTQQGVESFLATQQILLDVATRQNAAVMKTLREVLTSREHSPMSVLTDIAVEGTANFVEAERVLLDLVQQETDIVTNGVKERVGGSSAAVAMTEVVRRSVDTFVQMQHDFLTIVTKQTQNWLKEMQAGRGYDGSNLINVAREGIETFVHAQKKFLDVVSQEADNALTGKYTETRKTKQTDVSELARDATKAFMDAQKKLMDVAGQQMKVNVQAATRTMDMLKPFGRIPVASMTGEGVKNFVDTERALIDSMIKTGVPKKTTATPERRSRKRPAKRRKTAAKAAAASA